MKEEEQRAIGGGAWEEEMSDGFGFCFGGPITSTKTKREKIEMIMMMNEN